MSADRSATTTTSEQSAKSPGQGDADDLKRQ
jgi:hypothetical protein